MTTLLVSHAACLNHLVPDGHPERPDRLRAVLKALSGDGFADLVREEAPRAASAQLSLVHPVAHIDAILTSVPETGLHRLDPDTCLSPGSGVAALRAAGAVVHAVDRVMTGKADNAFCAVRPPGHHAEPERAMGFCLFNNVAIGARHGRAAHGATRVAIVDFDVHHGNGTAALTLDDPDLFYGSTHQAPFYPGTGAPDETGIGNMVNIPLPQGAASELFRAAMDDQLLPALEQFAPDLIMISAGFDAHHADPLGGLNLQDEDFTWITERLCTLAARLCNGRIVSSLEGGYDLDALGSAARAHVGALMSA